MEDLRGQMKEQIALAVSLGREALKEFKAKNFLEGQRKMRLAREAANTFCELKKRKDLSST